nr:protein phosphatase 2C domain-containing protein [Sphingomonas sp. 35-24ZXX]
MRAQNEDSCQVGDWCAKAGVARWKGPVRREGLWAAVADGMGGHRQGALASAIVIDSLSKLVPPGATDVDVDRLISEANGRMFLAMRSPEGSPAMGSTVVGVLVTGRTGIVFNVGDSRGYLLASGQLQLVTRDHTPPRGSTGGRSHALTQSLGGTLTPRPIVPHIFRFDLGSTDAILLCSDGLTDMVEDEEIEALLSRHPDDPADALVQAALDAGGADNITVVVVRITG